MTQEVASLSPPQQQLLLLSYCPPIIESCTQVVSPTAASHLCCSRSHCRPLLTPTINRCPQAVSPPATARHCCSRHWLVVSLLSLTRNLCCLLAGHFCCQSLTAALGRSCHQPSHIIPTTVDGWLLCCLPFVVTYHCAIVNALVAAAFAANHQLLWQ